MSELYKCTIVPNPNPYKTACKTWEIRAHFPVGTIVSYDMDGRVWDILKPDGTLYSFDQSPVKIGSGN